jgi:prevent-host-death family protein
MKKASIQEFRFHFKPLLERLRKGEELTLTYRNRPLARVVPLDPSPGVTEDDPALKFHEDAEPMGVLTNEGIDHAISSQA